MKKIFTAILLCVASAGWCATEYLRPTANSTAAASSACYGTYAASSSMSAVYASKTGTGPTGSSASLIANGASSSPPYEDRFFTAWATPTKSYTSLTLYVSAACTLGTAFTGDCVIFYSVNSGSTFISLFDAENINTSQATYSAVITGATLSNVQILACSNGGVGTISTGRATTVIYDIWTAGTYSAATSSTHTWLLSYLDEQIWRWHDIG